MKNACSARTEINEIAGHALSDDVVQAVMAIIRAALFCRRAGAGAHQCPSVCCSSIASGMPALRRRSADPSDLCRAARNRAGIRVAARHRPAAGAAGTVHAASPSMLFACVDSERRSLVCVGGSRHGQSASGHGSPAAILALMMRC